jgi:hypothetical protein
VEQLDAALADELHPLAQVRRQRERLAEQRLDRVAAVDVGVVEGGDAAVKALLDPAQPLARGPTPVGHAPAAGDDRGQGGWREGHAEISFNWST